jgi:hypothetical protein
MFYLGAGIMSIVLIAVLIIAGGKVMRRGKR